LHYSQDAGLAGSARAALIGLIKRGEDVEVRVPDLSKLHLFAIREVLELNTPPDQTNGALRGCQRGLDKRYECRVIASVDEAGEYVINTQFDHNGKSSITHSVEPAPTGKT
jgi:hypothetical protein